MSARPDLDFEKIKQALEREREELRAASAAAADERRPVEVDQQTVGRLSRMDALQAQAMAKAVEVRRQERRRRIEAALRRLAEGDYGYCDGCGEEIPAKRLAIDPTTTRCVDCAA